MDGERSFSNRNPYTALVLKYISFGLKIVSSCKNFPPLLLYEVSFITQNSFNILYKLINKKRKSRIRLT